MKKILGIFTTAIFVLSPFLANPLLAGDLGGLRNRLRGEVSGDDMVESVAGRSFLGNIRTRCGDIGSSCMSFDRDGNISWDQRFGVGPPEVFYGMFREFGQGNNTYWGAVLDDYSPDGVFTLVGVAVGKSTFMFLANIDQLCPDDGPPTTAIGIYLREKCTPGSRSSNPDDIGIDGDIGGLP